MFKTHMVNLFYGIILFILSIRAYASAIAVILKHTNILITTKWQQILCYQRLVILNNISIILTLTMPNGLTQ